MVGQLYLRNTSIVDQCDVELYYFGDTEPVIPGIDDSKWGIYELPTRDGDPLPVLGMSATFESCGFLMKKLEKNLGSKLHCTTRRTNQEDLTPPGVIIMDHNRGKNYLIRTDNTVLNLVERTGFVHIFYSWTEREKGQVITTRVPHVPMDRVMDRLALEQEHWDRRNHLR